MLENVGGQVPDDDISKAVFYLIKEVGLSHKEIFGDTEYVSIVEEVEREGFLGSTLDYVFGRQKKESTELVETRGLSVKAFAAYIELLEEHEEDKEKQSKKSEMKNNMNQTFN